MDRERHELREVDSAEVALLDERDGGDLAVGPRHLLDDRAPDPADRDTSRISGSGCPHVCLDDPSPGAGAAEADELDPELLRELPNARRRAHGVHRVRRDDRDERLRRPFDGSGAILRGDRAQELLARLTDHDEHGADGRHRAFLDEDLQDVPARGDGISTVVLSVCTSTSG